MVVNKYPPSAHEILEMVLRLSSRNKDSSTDKISTLLVTFTWANYIPQGRSCHVKWGGCCGLAHLSPHTPSFSLLSLVAFSSLPWMPLPDLQISSGVYLNSKLLWSRAPSKEGSIFPTSSTGCLPVDIHLLSLPDPDNRGWRVLI